jgi:hypothetical protein
LEDVLVETPPLVTVDRSRFPVVFCELVRTPAVRVAAIRATAMTAASAPDKRTLFFELMSLIGQERILEPTLLNSDNCR